MPRTIHALLVVTALVLLVPAAASAENPLDGLLAVQAPTCEAAEAPAAPQEEAVQDEDAELAPGEERISIEELSQLFGAHNVCGVPCGGVIHKNCTRTCGDAAACFQGRCLYL